MTYGNISSLKTGLGPNIRDDYLIGEIDGKALYAGDLRALIERIEDKSKEEAVEKVEPFNNTDLEILRFAGDADRRSAIESTRAVGRNILRLVARIDHERERVEKAEAEAKRLREAAQKALDNLDLVISRLSAGHISMAREGLRAALAPQAGKEALDV